jgi:hypothetical protein
MSRSDANTELAMEIEARLLAYRSSPEPKDTFSEEARRALAQAYSVLLDLARQRRAEGTDPENGRNAPASAEEVHNE